MHATTATLRAGGSGSPPLSNFLAWTARPVAQPSTPRVMT